MKPTWTRRLPCFISASTMRMQPAAVVARGFSQNTGFPTAMEASTNSSWVGPHEVTTTTSTSGAAITSRPVESARAPIAAATSLARLPSMSVTATTLAPPIRWLIRRAGSTPIAPVPMTPTLYAMAQPMRYFTLARRAFLSSGTARARILGEKDSYEIGALHPALSNAATWPRLSKTSEATTRTRSSSSIAGFGLPAARSEEHTSELQSQFHLVCRLLLEKKKKHSNPLSLLKKKKKKKKK